MDIGALLNLDVTTASRFADKLSNAPGIMSVVTSDEVRRFGGITLGETLQRVPGLTGSTQYLADRSQVAALGDQTKASGGHILFPINGRPTREVLEGGIISGLLESFPVAVLKRIEIVKGPGSVLYGSNAFSAAINLITLKATHNQATALAMSGPGGGMSSAATGTYQRGDLSVVAAGQNHDAPDWRPTYSVPLSERNDPTVPAVSNVQYPTLVERGSGGYLGLNYKDLSFMSAFTEWQSNGVTEGTVSETRLTRVFGNPGYDHKVAQNRDMNYNLAFTRTTFTANDFPFVKRDSNEFIAGWTSFITLTPRDRLTAGAPFSRIAGVEDFTAASPPLVVADGSRSGGAFYARIDHRLGDEVKLIGGFQTNKIGDLALNTVPRAGAIWTPTNPIGVNALYGQAFRAPSLDENLLNHPVIKGNPDLLPGTVGTFNVGIGCQRNRFQIGVDYFHSKQSNLITDIPSIPDIVPFHYVNVGEIAFHGAELEGKYYFGKDFFVQGSFLYQTNEDGNGNANVSPVPDFGFKAGMSYENRRGLTLSLFDVSGGPINGAAYTQDIDPGPGWHHVINAHLRYDFSKYLPPTAKYGVALAAHANNPINREVWLPSGLYSTAWTASRLSRGVSFTWGLNSPRAGSGRPTSEETPCAHD